MSVVTISSAPVRRLLVLGWLLASFGLLAMTRNCQDDDRPIGFHSPNVVWGDGQLGLVWLNRSADGEHLMYARAGEDARLQDAVRVLSRRATGSAIPLIAFDGTRYLAAWTHRGRRRPGLYVRTFAEDGRRGEELRLLPDADIELCRQLVWTGDAYAIAWADAQSLHLGILSPHASLTQMPTRIATRDIGQCRLAFDGVALGLAWTDASGADAAVNLARISTEGKLLQRDRFSAGEGDEVRALDLAWQGGAYRVSVAPADHTGVTVLRISAALEELDRLRVDHRGGYVRGVAVTGVDPVILWSQRDDARARRGTVYLGALGPDGLVGDAYTLGKPGRARDEVNAASSGRKIAVTGSDDQSRGTVSWGVLRPRRGATTSQPATASVSSAQ
jgi:hypothetical protein